MSSPVLTPLELPKSGSKVLVITAHPDDVDFGAGGFFVQMKSKIKVVNPAMFHGALTQLVTGIALVGLAESGAVDEN